MTDRNLIELAAKAAGVCLHPVDQRHRSYGNWGCDTTCMVCRKDPSDMHWNPLKDDGDALRLAARLELDVMHRVVGRKRIEVLPAGGPLFQYPYEGTDTAAAWRNAIVRAAAEIGRKSK